MALISRRTITAIKRAKSSRNGNPSFIITFSDESSARTQADTSWAYEVDDSMIGKEFFVNFTPSGLIRFAKAV